MSAPSSPTKRRLVSTSKSESNGDVTGSTTPPQPKAGKRRKIPSGAENNNGTSSTPQIMSEDEINQILASLALPDPQTQVAVQYSNSISDTEVQAYAKLAGSTWTYYVQNIEIVVGRTSDPNNPGQERIDIDLGPAKVVSRRHAVIKYNTKTRHWEIHILGRNGVRVDRIHYKEGSVVLGSGNILDIGGVQMMFVLPDEPPKINFNPALVNNKATNHHKATSSVSSVQLSPKNRHDEPVQYQQPPHQAQYYQDPQIPPIQQQQQQQQPPPLPQYHYHQPSSSTDENSVSYTNDSTGSYPKGVAIITRPQVRGMNENSQYQEQDLSSDDAKDIKPPYSYATMITQAIMSTDEMMMSLSEIYDWIATNYSFYRHSKSGWQNSIRHNLSLNKAFEKVPRKANEPGKGKKWQITPQFKEEFIRKANLGKLAKGSNSKRNSGMNNSQQHQQVLHLSQPPPPQQQLPPPQQMTYQQQQQQLPHLPPPLPHPIQPPISNPPPLQPGNIQYSEEPNSSLTAAVPTSSNATVSDFQTPQKQSNFRFPSSDQNGPTSVGSYSDQYSYLQFSNGQPLPMVTPSPSRRYPVSQLEAYTPDRGSNVNNNNSTDDKKTNNHSTNGTNNSNGNGYQINNNNPPNTNGKFQHKMPTFASLTNNTPAPQAHHLQLAPPSSAQQSQLPSSFMPGSSPAPFWKYMQFSSTPIRGGNNDFSPTKFSSSPAVGVEPTPSGKKLSTTTNETPLKNNISDNDNDKNHSNDPTTRQQSDNKDERENSLGDLQDVDLTRGFGHIGKWRESTATTTENTNNSSNEHV